MNILILNANPQSEYQSFDRYLDRLSASWIQAGHRVYTLKLREMTIAYCTGCWSCWVNTPGECKSRDDSRYVCLEVVNSDLTVMASPVIMGFPSALLKKVMDKLIPIVHPYIVLEKGEAHHLSRYDHYPKIALLTDKCGDTDDEDIQIITEIFHRNALNMKTELVFIHNTLEPVEEVAHEINHL